MKYAIIYETSYNGNKRHYLKGFTNIKIERTAMNDGNSNSFKYTTELKELSSLFIKLEGDAEQYLAY